MTSSRYWIATTIALSFPLAALAQSESAPAGSSGGSAPSAPTPSAPPSSAFSSTVAPATNGSGASSSFGTPSSGGTSGSLFDIFSNAGGYTTEPAGGTGPTLPSPEAPPSFTLPGFYGQGSSTIFGGSGRSRPQFEMSLGFSVGYDDNIFQTPSDTPSIPGASVVVDEGRDPGLVVVRNNPRGFEGSGGFTSRTPPTVAEDPGQAPVLGNEEVRQERVGSFLTRSDLTLQLQRVSARSLFSLDLNGGRTFYWDKDEDPVDYNGSLSVSFLQRLTPRLQLTGQFNTAYISQPDLSRINTPDRPTQGDIINSLARVNLAYRLTPRFSTTGTLSYAGNRYTEKVEQTNDYDQWTLGLEGRYLWKPRWTLLAEIRQTKTTYDQQPILDSMTEYFLVGSEFIFSARLNGSLRVGMNFKQFDVGKNQSSPYVESTVYYRSTARSTVSWTNRFGFEESSSPNDERLVYRSTIAYTYAFTPRLRGSANINLLHEITTNTVSNDEAGRDTFDSNIGLNYQLTKRFSLNANYAFTILSSSVENEGYYRNRIFFGGAIDF